MPGQPSSETFTERFNRLTASLSRKQIGQLLDLTDGAVRKLQEGTTQSLKAHGAITLARHLKVPVEYLAERGPLPRREPGDSGISVSAPEGLQVALDGSDLTIGLEKGAVLYGGTTAEYQATIVQMVRKAVSERLKVPAPVAGETESPDLSVQDTARVRDALRKLSQRVAKLERQARDG